MSPVSFIVMALACYRLSGLLASEAGPWDMLHRFRHWLGVRYDEHNEPYGTNMPSRGIICYYCNSVWIGLGLTILYLISPGAALAVSLPFALSGVAILPILR